MRMVRAVPRAEISFSGLADFYKERCDVLDAVLRNFEPWSNS